MKVADVIMPRMWWMTHRHALSLCSAVCVVCGREGRGRPKFGGGTPGNTTRCRLSWVFQSSTKLGISSCSEVRLRTSEREPRSCGIRIRATTVRSSVDGAMVGAYGGVHAFARWYVTVAIAHNYADPEGRA